MTFRFGNDATLQTRTMAIHPVGTAKCRWSTSCARGAWSGTTLVVKSFFKKKKLGRHIDLGRGHMFFEKLGVRDEQTVATLAPPTDKFCSARTQDSS